jgi:hypothetical protein
MKRVHRWLFNGLAAWSALLCVAMVTIWVRGYFVADEIVFRRPGADQLGDHGQLWDEFDATASRGHFLFEFSQSDERRDYGLLPAPLLKSSLSQFRHNPRDLVATIDRSQFTTIHPKRFGGFEIGDEWYLGAHADSEMKYLALPDWPFMFLPAILPAIVLRRWRRCVQSIGQCRVCDYDLRATPDRCPECGTILTPKTI